ncbi:hypothetical protein [Agrococcus carbonis]|uniref:Lipoprotein n=1 Tax=Agrococcus carbonis TaxID=684552 RepID=A0A1H1PHN5_9MICO|nr:hypothetical protein [Agrococcus carbonis]SDS10600.1 hypothetical protein SAMN04489719_1554 [Agrococcus carbonis]
MSRAPRVAALLLTSAVAVSGCAVVGPAGQGSAEPAPASSPTASGAAPDGPHLVAEGLVFDAAAHDVDPDGDCEGVSGRERWESFDRAAWPALDVPAGSATLTCGNASGAGWRHIADGHTGDFGELADPIGASWEDVAVFAIDRALEQPTRVEPYRDDIVNYDVLVELVGADEPRSWMVTVGVGLGTGQVITAFPDEQ